MSDIESVPEVVRRTARAKKEISEYRPEDSRVQWTDLHFYCGWFHHITHLPNNYCAIIYQLALKLSHESGIFDASAINIAHDLGCNEKTIRRAIELLRNTGWFVRIKRSRKPGEYIPNAYNVLDHENWAEAHPNLCGERIDDKMPWGEGERIAQFLYHHTGGAVKWREFETKKMLSFGHPNHTLQKFFRLYWSAEGWQEDPARVPAEFNRFLKEVANQQQVKRDVECLPKQNKPVPKKTEGPNSEQAENFLRQLVTTSKGKLNFDEVDLAPLLKHRQSFGDEQVKQALEKWLRENDLSSRTRNQATHDFIQDVPRLVFIEAQKARNREAAAKFSSADGLSDPVAWTQ